MSINVVYNPAPAPQDRISFWNPDSITPNAPVNFVLLAEGATSLTLQLINQGSKDSQATFSSPAIAWNFPPGLPAQYTVEGSSISVTLPQPLPMNYFQPFSFSVLLDTASLKGISSPTFFLAKPPTTQTEHNVNVNYDPNTGAFTLDQGFSLGGQTLLVNTVPNLQANFTLVGASFAQDFLVWTAGQQPPWLQLLAPSPSNPLKLTFMPRGLSQGAGFRFIVNFNGTSVASPDPILINATLGDGTSVLFPALGS